MFRNLERRGNVGDADGLLKLRAWLDGEGGVFVKRLQKQAEKTVIVGLSH